MLQESIQSEYVANTCCTWFHNMRSLVFGDSAKYQTWQGAVITPRTGTESRQHMRRMDREGRLFLGFSMIDADSLSRMLGHAWSDKISSYCFHARIFSRKCFIDLYWLSSLCTFLCTCTYLWTMYRWTCQPTQVLYSFLAHTLLHNKMLVGDDRET